MPTKWRACSRRNCAQPAYEVAFPREANALFVHLPDEIAEKIEARGWHFSSFFEPDVYRLMCSWATTEADIEQFITDCRSSSSCHPEPALLLSS